VTHCGWNSTLEAIVAGVPMLCWPLGAEQKMNKVLMVDDDMGIGVELEGYNAGFVKAEEIEAKVKLVLESGDGRAVRERAADLKKEAEAAMEDGGSSRVAFLQFLSDVKTLRE
jgi:UDP:flavonoid glycosyltransferase YjiC (YdhE family)